MTTKPKILKSFPESSAAGRKPTYPWDEWTDGQTRELIRGEHFPCEAKSLRTLVHRTAPKFGLHAKTKIVREVKKAANSHEEDEVIEKMFLVFYKDKG